MYSPKFTITPQIANTIAQIEALRALIDQSKILPEREINLRYRATVEAVHSSTTIEGNPLTKNEVEAVLAGKRVAQAEYAITEVANYKKALDWLEKRREQRTAISPTDVLKLHGLVMAGLLPKEKSGKFRPGAVYIVDILGKIEKVRYIAPDADKVKILLSEMFYWLEHKGKELHPVLAASILHYEFVSIHPFSDGNGRVTRLLTMLYLSLRDYNFRDVLVPDIYYLEHRMEYYDALNRAKVYTKQRSADLTPWVNYFVTGFLDVAQNLKNEISFGSNLKLSTKKVVRLSKQELLLLDYTKQMGSISLGEGLDVLEIPRRTAQRRLSELVDKALLKPIGNGKNTVYILTT